MAIVRQFAMIVLETVTYGTPKVSPVAGTDLFYVPISESNAFSGTMEPRLVETPWGGGWDVLGDVQAADFETKGSLSIFGYPALAAILAKAAITRVNSGQTAPWTTPEPPGDLASISFYHGFQLRSGTVKRRRLAGGKVAKFTGQCSTKEPRLKLKVDFLFQKEVGNPVDSSSDPDATEFPLPGDSDFPRGPYLHQHSKGEFKLASTAIVGYESLNLVVTNKLAPGVFEDRYPSLIECEGRETTLDANLLLRSSPDMRARLQGVTEGALVVKWNNGTNTLTIDLKAKAHVAKADYDLPVGELFMQPVQFKSKYDSASGVDLSVSST